MRERLARRVLAAALPVAAVSFAWASLEHDARARVFAGVAALSLASAVPARLPLRIALGAATLAGLTLAAAGTRVHEVRQLVDRGLEDIYDTAPPFVAHSHHELHVLVLLAAAAFCIAVAVTAGSRPFLAAGVAAAGLGWPATVMPDRNTLAMGALGLAAALWPVLVASLPDRRGVVPGAAALVLVVVAGLVAAGAGAKPSRAALDWQSWDLFGESRVGRVVALVWSSNYSGIDFPSQKTTVLEVTAPHRALYWRASTLDLFSSDHWVEALYSTGISGRDRGFSGGDRTLPHDPLLPVAAERRDGWVRQDVDVRALVDSHVLAASQPMQLAAGDHRVQFLSSGIMRAAGGLGDMRRYTVWSYAPRPTPGELVRSPAIYPDGLYRYLDIGRAVVPQYGFPGRAALVDGVFEDERYQPIWPYKALWRSARRVTAGTTSPYQATVRLERWLRTDGGFGYDEHPPAPRQLPPLVDFVERSKLGYCQQFAGSMALMLRYLGIPSRVAVGFTSGTWKDGTWTVTDHEAHAWVEAWFSGYGWLTFDPTPGRGRLSATYTNASDSADAIRALGTGRFLGPGSSTGGSTPAPVQPLEQPGGGSWSWVYYLAPLVLLAVALVLLAAVKQARRLRRRATRDPRAAASAARADLVDFVRDQGAGLAPAASIGELTAALRRLGVAGDAFAAAFSRARYGPPDGAVTAATEARRERRRVLSLLRARVGAARRLRGFLAVRSLRHG